MTVNDTVTELWQAGLKKRRNKEGDLEVVPNASNAALLLTHHEDFRGVFAFDSFAYRIIVQGSLPPIPGLSPPREGPIEDQHVIYAGAALGFKMRGPSWSFESVNRGIELAAHQREFNPVKDALVKASLTWDGRSRMRTWLSDYLGAPNDEYTWRVAAWFLISAVARAFEPGCQADHMLVLQGLQGEGKSTAARILGGKWTLEKLPKLRDYDRAAHALAGRWIVEVGELDAMKGAAMTEIKDFLSLRHDTYRPPYGRNVVTRPRTVVCIATTNEHTYLRDHTGLRRFWPVSVRTLNRSGLESDRDQLWAEATLAYQAGVKWWPEREDASFVEPEQEDRRETDAWEELVENWCEDRDDFSMAEVLSGLGIDRSKWGRDEQTRVGIILTRLGFEKKRLREQGLRHYRYYRIKKKD